ncbi:MAG: hypothetical protein IIC87_05505 [Chloroflexi bacterium]|nr:hypothetical protein [Chloroflexota bacterium]
MERLDTPALSLGFPYPRYSGDLQACPEQRRRVATGAAYFSARGSNTTQTRRDAHVALERMLAVK